MAVEQKQNILLRILPKTYKYHIHGISVREVEEHPTEVKLEAHFRVNIKDEVNFNKFMSEFSKSSGTSYNKPRQGDRSGPRASLFGIRKCIHNVKSKNEPGVSELNKNGNKTGKLREPGKDTKCEADIQFSIATPCETNCSHKNGNTHYLKQEYPLEIKLYYNHNHPIQAADALRFRPVSDETKKLFEELFDEDVSPSSAYRRVLDHFESNDDICADRFYVPDYKWVFNFHAKYIKNKFGSSNGVDILNKLKENITKYNEERGEELAKVEQTVGGETIIAICDMFNRRVHQNIPAAGDLVIMDGTANLDRNDSKIYHMMSPSPVGGLPLGTLITTRGDEATITEALELYKSLVPENGFFGRGKNLGPKLVLTDDDAAEKNSLRASWPESFQLLCSFHCLQALWTWLWKGEHKIEKDDRPILFNLFKNVLYSKTTHEFNRSVKIMKKNIIYRKYENFKYHIESEILPRHAEWSMRERFENKLPTHNQNTSNYVEYSFRMTKDIQFDRLKAYNLADLLDICLDDSVLYSRRCLDVSHNRNYHLFTNQKSKYLFNQKKTNINPESIIQLSAAEFLVPSETIADTLYRVDIEAGLCECPQGFLKGPCKHKGIVSHTFKLRNFETLPQQNEKMRAFYYFLGTGGNRDVSWFRPLNEENPFLDLDWSEIINSQDNNFSDSQECQEQINTAASVNREEKEQVLESLRDAVSNIVEKVDDRFEEDEVTYTKAVKTFVKKTAKLVSANDATFQKALFTFAQDFVTSARKGKRKKSLKIPVQTTARSRRRFKHRGTGPSILGRPTKPQSLKVQLQVTEDQDYVAHQIPSNRTKRKKPHSLAASVAANRASERKH